MQGTVHPVDNRTLVRRFIPAYAGNRLNPTHFECSIAVHPRICREQSLQLLNVTLRCGSSPHMQGTGVKNSKQLAKKRFIPAYAGNREPRQSRQPVNPVHPRICREQGTAPVSPARQPGSSPHMQGTGVNSRGTNPSHRFIPAYAGNRQVRWRPNTVRSVHPRICREQDLILTCHF